MEGYDGVNRLYKIRYLDGTTDEYDHAEMKQYHKHLQAYSKAKYNKQALQTKQLTH